MASNRKAVIYVTFDLSFFADFGSWLFGAAKQLYSLLNFNFGDFTVNGWWLIIGTAAICIVVRIFNVLD